MTMLTVVLLLVVGVAVFVEVLSGLKRGLVRSAISLCAVIFSALVSAPLAAWLSDAPSEWMGKLLLRYISPLESLLEQFPRVGALVVAGADVILSLILFLIFFVILQTLCRILWPLFLHKWLKPLPDEVAHPLYESTDAPFHRRHDRVLGGITGGLCGFLAALILLSPVVGTLSAADHALSVTDRFKVKWESFGLTADAVYSLRETTGDPAVRVLEAMGGGLIYDAAAHTKLNDRRVYLRGEVEACADVVGDLYGMVLAVSRPDLAKQPLDRETVERLGENLERSEAAKMVAADFLNLATGAWLEGKTFMKLKCPDGGDLFNPLLRGALAVCAESTPECVARDITTLLNIYLIATENGLLTDPDYEKLAGDLGESGVLGQIYDELRRNPCMAHLADELTNLALRIMASAIDWSELDRDVFENLMGDLSDAMNKVGDMNTDREGRVEAMKEYARYYAAQYGVELPEALAEMAAIAMVDRLSGQGNVTPDDMADLFGGYLSGSKNN